MFSNSGISWRHGPHQLAQKLSITTWPLYCARLNVLPPLAPRVNWGAGPLGSPASAGRLASNAVAINAVIRFFMFRILSLKEDGRPDRRRHIVGELGDTQQIRPENTILDLYMDRDPVRRQQLVTPTEVHRESIVAGELGGANPTEKIESARQGGAPT